VTTVEECNLVRSPTDGRHARWAMGGDKLWQPAHPWGCCGWQMVSRPPGSSVIITRDHETDPDHVWVHASLAHRDRVPSYEELTKLKLAAFGSGWAYQVFAPPSEHVNIHDHALHLWGRLDGARVLPDFGRFGTI
jgi:hypothetical protein